jgi:O-antigen biosynthesis protein
MQCHTLSFSYDRDLYKKHTRREPEIRRVFCYCRPPTIRRGLETALLSLDLVGKKLPDVKFIFAGWDMGDYEFSHEHLNAGILSVEDLPDLYSQCDVALVISFSNLSLLPLELMACGCAVVSNKGSNIEWLLNDSNSALSNPDPQSIANTIIDLLDDSEGRNKLTEHAISFASSTNWNTEGAKLASILENLAT